MSNTGKTSLSPSAATRGRPKVRSDEAQRKLIADCAIELFLIKGYGRTTTEDIAARCRISKQTLYRLFPGKPALFAAIVDRHRYSMLALPGDYDDLPLDRALEQIFNIDIEPAAHEERMALIRLVILEAHQNPELKEILHHHGADRSHADLAKWLKRRSKREAIDIGDAKHSARLLMDMMFGAFAFKTFNDTGNWRTDDLAKHIRRFISVFLNGIRPR
ncbi:TetR/AcrR family transcriptional regulator [Rhodopseudomonas sp. NSM]|uniref:TetR/AcrR family transcriptional regulator n=1 Tax=Rhodopseudomonas sp. NSM TaxID=3457630 RepID=UPI00403710F8